MVVEAVLVAVLVLTTVLFFTSIQRPTRAVQEGSVDLNQIASDVLRTLMTQTFNDPASGNAAGVGTWSTRIMAGDSTVAGDVDAYIVGLVPSGARYALRLDNGLAGLPILPYVGTGNPVGGQAAETPFFPRWSANADQTRTVTDGVTTSGSTTVTSSTAKFVAGDVGKRVFGAGIVAGATIASRTSATAVVLSTAATASAAAVTVVIDLPSAQPGDQVASGHPLYSLTQAATTKCIQGPVPDAKTILRTRTVTDGATTSGSTTVTSTAAVFAAADVGKRIAALGIPLGTTIASVADPSTAVVSVAATATAAGLTMDVLDIGAAMGPSGMTVVDGVTTSGSATVTSATANFAAGDVGKPISGAGIPPGSTIASRTSATTVVMSGAATVTATAVTLGIGATWVSFWQGQTAGQERVPASLPYGVWSGYPNADCTGVPVYGRIALASAPPPNNLPLYGLQLVIWYGA